MMWYVRVRRVGAVLVEMRRDFGWRPVWAFVPRGYERVINLPFIQIVITPWRCLEQEHIAHATRPNEPSAGSGPD